MSIAVLEPTAPEFTDATAEPQCPSLHAGREIMDLTGTGADLPHAAL